MAFCILEDVTDSKRIERFWRHAADKFATNPMPRITSRFVQRHRNPPLSQRDSHGETSEPAADDGNHSLHARRRNEPRQSMDS